MSPRVEGESVLMDLQGQFLTLWKEVVSPELGPSANAQGRAGLQAEEALGSLTPAPGKGPEGLSGFPGAAGPRCGRGSLPSARLRGSGGPCRVCVLRTCAPF